MLRKFNEIPWFERYFIIMASFSVIGFVNSTLLSTTTLFRGSDLYGIVSIMMITTNKYRYTKDNLLFLRRNGVNVYRANLIYMVLPLLFLTFFGFFRTGIHYYPNQNVLSTELIIVFSASVIFILSLYSCRWASYSALSSFLIPYVIMLFGIKIGVVALSIIIIATLLLSIIEHIKNND